MPLTRSWVSWSGVTWSIERHDPGTSEVSEPFGESREGPIRLAWASEVGRFSAVTMNLSSWSPWRRRALRCFRTGRLAGAALAALLLAQNRIAAGVRLAVIGDSLSAEYDALPDIPGVDDPTAYAAVTVPGWESRCWVEVLGLLRPGAVDLGPQKPDLPGWGDFRFTGYKYNFAIPGYEASQYEDIVDSSLFSNPQYLLFRGTLRDVLKNDVDTCVVWIGANDFRANYGFLADGGDPVPLIQGLRQDLGKILDFVTGQSSSLRVVVVNLPDLGATPTKQAAHPDPAKRDRASQDIALANQAINEVASAHGLPVADVFSATRRLIEGENIWFGAIEIQPGTNPDNDPHFAFARDGLHPNTGLQIEIARIIVATMNERYGAAIPAITDAEALGLLGISPQEPYLNWVTAHALAANGMSDDPDQDGIANLVEFVFDLDPKSPSPSPMTIAASAAGVDASYRADPARLRLAGVTPRWSTDLLSWTDIPTGNLTTAGDGRVTVHFPAKGSAGYLRLDVALKGE